MPAKLVEALANRLGRLASRDGSQGLMLAAACNPSPPDAGCGSTPTLHPEAAGSIYCGPMLTCSS